MRLDPSRADRGGSQRATRRTPWERASFRSRIGAPAPLRAAFSPWFRVARQTAIPTRAFAGSLSPGLFPSACTVPSIFRGVATRSTPAEYTYNIATRWNFSFSPGGVESTLIRILHGRYRFLNEREKSRFIAAIAPLTFPRLVRPRKFVRCVVENNHFGIRRCVLGVYVEIILPEI